MLKKLTFTACLIAASSTLIAQTTGTATIVGIVTDNTGAVIAGAKITVLSQERQFVYNAVTNNEGYYYVPYLQPGTYNVAIEFAGFKKVNRTGIQLRTNESPRIDVQMEVGAVTESIEVQGAAPLLETETSIAGGVMEGKTLVKIPVMQKLTFSVIPYLPDTQFINGFHANGQRERAMGYALDGLGAKEPVTGAVGATNRVVTSSIDAVSEIKVYATGMPAEFGHSAGGQLSVIFRSGSNGFHGSGEDRFFYKNMLHRNYFDIAKPLLNTYHEISALASGPVMIPKIYNGKDKTFWLFGFARHHEHASETFLGDVPSQDMLNGDFSFGGRGLPIYDPATTRQLANGSWTRDPFAGNVVPRARFDPVTVNYLANKPFTAPNNAGSMDAFGPHQNLNEFTTYGSFRTRWDAKLDHQFSPKHKIFGRYSQSHHTSFRDRWVNEANWRLIDPNAIPFPIDQPNIVVSDTYTISPTVINEFRVGFNRRKTTRDPESAGQDWAKKLGIPGVGPQTFPELRGSGGGRYYRTGPGGVSSEVWEDFTIQNNLTKVLGKHTLKGGYEVVRTRYNILAESLPSGQYNLAGTEFPFAPGSTTGNEFANLLLGYVGSAQFTRAQATWLPRWTSHAWYFQDDFKPRRNLTINLGVRWSYESPFSTKYGQQSQFDPTARDPITGRTGAIVHTPGQLAKKDLNNFQPRFGVAWNVKPKIVIRGNFGVMHQDMFMTNLAQNFEEYFATANVQAPTGDPRPAFRLSQGPGPVNFTTNADGSVPFVGTNFSARNATWIDPNIRIPYIMNWSTGFQWEFMPNLLMDVSYQGSRGVNLLNSWDINAIPLNISRDVPTLTNIRNNAQNFKPYTQFGSVNLFSNFGDNSYHSGTLRVERRYRSGLFVNAFYTWSKNLTNADGDGGTGGVTFYNRALEKGRSNFDVAHRFLGMFVYQLPYGKGRKYGASGIKNSVFGGWDLVFSQMIQTGPPITVGFSGGPLMLPGALRPNQVLPNDQAVTQNWTIGTHRYPTALQNPYINAAAFAYPSAFTPGTLGRNTLESPGLIWAQISMSKEWAITETVKFQLRWDMNNPYKRNNLADPNRTYNSGSLPTFGRFTGDRGSFGAPGGRLHSFLVLRMEW